MAETLFVADETDARNSVANVIAVISVVFLEKRRWDSPWQMGSKDLGDYPQLCRDGLTFFVLTSSSEIRMTEAPGAEGCAMWEFDYATTSGWIMVEPGGRWKKGDDVRWVPGRIRSNLSDLAERRLYTEFKKLWLKGYKPGKEGLRFGPSAIKTLANETLATW